MTNAPMVASRVGRWANCWSIVRILPANSAETSALGLGGGFGDWLAGFIDGEGCFSIERVNRKRGVVTYKPVFGLALRIDDRPILEEIACRTGIGFLYSQPATGRPGSINEKCLWFVRSRRDCAELVRLLETYPLRAKKRREFEIWTRAVHEHASKSHRGNSVRNDWSGLAQLWDELKYMRRAGLPDAASAGPL